MSICMCQSICSLYNLSKMVKCKLSMRVILGSLPGLDKKISSIDGKLVKFAVRPRNFCDPASSQHHNSGWGGEGGGGGV